MKIDIKELEKLNFEDGEKLLLANGYVSTYEAEDYECVGCDYISDCYYQLSMYDEDEVEDVDEDAVHTVSWVEWRNINDDPQNDDHSLDYVIKSYWKEV